MSVLFDFFSSKRLYSDDADRTTTIFFYLKKNFLCYILFSYYVDPRTINWYIHVYRQQNIRVKSTIEIVYFMGTSWRIENRLKRSKT